MRERSTLCVHRREQRSVQNVSTEEHKGLCNGECSIVRQKKRNEEIFYTEVLSVDVWVRKKKNKEFRSRCPTPLLDPSLVF
jgi:hypothetical protein